MELLFHCEIDHLLIRKEWRPELATNQIKVGIYRRYDWLCEMCLVQSLISLRCEMLKQKHHTCHVSLFLCSPLVFNMPGCESELLILVC